MSNPGISDTAVVVAIFGSILSVLVTVTIFFLHDMKESIDDLWRRANNHHHEVECSNDKCHVLKTGAVIID